MRGAIRVHCFFSVKGGVGKSTLAVAKARLTPHPERCVVLDMDLTGSSLAEGLKLQAPDIALHGDGSMDLDAAPTERFLSVDRSRAARDTRKRAEPGLWLPPPFMNDVFRYYSDDPERDCRLDAMCWQDERASGIRYMPSSSIDREIISSLGWLFQDHSSDGGAWLQRFAWILYTFLEQMKELEDIVLDMAPGIFGFTREVLSLLARLAARGSLPQGYPDLSGSAEWDVRPYLVTSEDRQDLYLAMESFATMHRTLSTMVPLLNRQTAPLEKAKSDLDRRFKGSLVQGLGHRIRSVGEHRGSLGHLFVEGELSLKTEEQEELREVFNAGESR